MSSIDLFEKSFCPIPTCSYYPEHKKSLEGRCWEVLIKRLVELKKINPTSAEVNELQDFVNYFVQFSPNYKFGILKVQRVEQVIEPEPNSWLVGGSVITFCSTKTLQELVHSVCTHVYERIVFTNISDGRSTLFCPVHDGLIQ